MNARQKLTDKEIIKTLEDEIHLAEYVDSDYCSNVKLEIIKSALGLISRQQCEIIKQKCIKQLLREDIKTAKSEAYKEFAERVKEFMHNKFKALDEYEFEYITERDINNLLKEIEGENNSDE